MPTPDPPTSAAYAACIHFIQPIIQAKQAGAAAQAAPQLAALTSYAQCMRSHDIAMLDPTPLGAAEPGQRARHHQRLRPVLAAVPRRPTRPAATCSRPGVRDDGTGP